MNIDTSSINTSPVVATITQHNAQQQLIDESMNRLVVASFWAESSPHSLQVKQTLERIAAEYAGDFLLGNINASEQLLLAQQLKVRSLPTVMLIREGRPVDGFSGPQSEAEIRAMLDRHLPKPWDKQLLQAGELMEQQAFAQAIPLLRSALHDSGQRSDISLALAQCYIQLNRLDEAGALLGAIPMADQDALYQQLLAQLQLKRTATKTPETQALETALAADPHNLGIKMQLAVRYSQEQHLKEALEHLIQILRQERNFGDGAARETMLDIFRSLGNQDPLVIEYQRQLFSLLY